MTSALASLEAAVQLYFDGLYEGDVDKLARVFHPRASLFIAAEGELVVLPVPQWLERVANHLSPASTQAPRDDAILMIDRVGPVNALVKVRCMLPPTTYTDHLSFIECEGRWQIVAKSYCKT